jgi:acyl-coenzyme A synthetase/AMP-(fatty) acid ligase
LGSRFDVVRKTAAGETVSVAFQDEAKLDAAPALPLIRGPWGRMIAFRAGNGVDTAAFLADVLALAADLPAGSAAVNLCEDRYAFLVAFCALAATGRTNLLPPSRTPQAVADVLAAHPGAFVLSECAVEPQPPRFFQFALGKAMAVKAKAIPCIAAEQIVAIGYTSGSTGTPKANPKSWGGFCASTARNALLLGMTDFERPVHLLATVPSQHMYGLETSVLLPLLAACVMGAARPLFPADVARELRDLPAPRTLVTTPVHLRALVQDATVLPPLHQVVSATAPLPRELAVLAEDRWHAPIVEVFGSTETCVIAHRRTAHEEAWHLYDGISLRPQPDGTLVEAASLHEPVLLQDIVELFHPGQFRLCGRSNDLLEIAGKRASLGDLTRRLLALSGVEDGVIFQLDADSAGVRRLAALVVAPERCELELIAELRQAVDPAFLPRPLKRVTCLPRNETGKLPRCALLAAIGAAALISTDIR